MSVAQNSSIYKFPVRVYYEDTDAAGVVYYANYFRFMERARTEWLTAIGIELVDLEQNDHIVFVVTRAEANYKNAARLGDHLIVTVEPIKYASASFTVRQRIWRDETLLVDGKIAVATLDTARWRPTRIPDSLLTRLPPLSEASS
jgi:tol-pal system-associated acyl-CoA thioesterase